VKAALLALLLVGCATPDFHLRATVQSNDGPDLDLSYQGQPLFRYQNPDGSVHWQVDESFADYNARSTQTREIVVSRGGTELSRIHLQSTFCHTAIRGGDPTGESYEVLLHADGTFCYSDQRCQFTGAVSDLPTLCN
jgi:hypothetical protein